MTETRTISGHVLGRPPIYDAAHFVRVAEVYNAHLIRPTSTVADSFGVTKTTAAKWVSRCRERGLIPLAGLREDDGA